MLQLAENREKMANSNKESLPGSVELSDSEPELSRQSVDLRAKKSWITDLDAEVLKLNQLVKDINNYWEPVKNVAKILEQDDFQEYVSELTDTIYDHILLRGTLEVSQASANNSLSKSFIEGMKQLIEELSSVNENLDVSTKKAVENLLEKLFLEYVDFQKIHLTHPSVAPKSSLSLGFSDSDIRILPNTDSNRVVGLSGVSLNYFSGNLSGLRSPSSSVHTEDRNDLDISTENPAANELASALIARFVKKGSKGPGQELTINFEHLKFRIAHEVNTNYSDVQICPDKIDKFVKKVTKDLLCVYGTDKMLREALNEGKEFTENLIICLKLQLSIHAHAKTRKKVFQRIWTSLKKVYARVEEYFTPYDLDRQIEYFFD